MLKTKKKGKERSSKTRQIGRRSTEMKPDAENLLNALHKPPIFPIFHFPPTITPLFWFPFVCYQLCCCKM